MTIRWFIRRLLALVALSLTLVGLVLAAEHLGSGPGLLTGTSARDDPLRLATEVVRLSAMAGACWLTLVTLVDTLATLIRLRPVLEVTAALAPAFWRQAVLKPAVALAIAVPPVVAPVTAMVPAAAAIVETVEPAAAETVEPADTESVEPSRADPDLPRALIMSVAALNAPTTSAPTTAPLTESVDATPRTLTMRRHEPLGTTAPGFAPVPGQPAPSLVEPDSTHVVVSGDNLWSIAAARLTEARGERPTAREVTPYWRALIDANRQVLPDPANPDLLFPGVQLTLPPVG